MTDTKARGRAQKRPSRVGTDGYRHEDECALRGFTLAEVSLNADLCSCDPHGTKARAMQISLNKHRRRTVLHQDEVWYPREGDPVRLDEMSLRWKQNLLAFLERRAPQLQAGYLEATAWSLVGAAEHATDQVMAEVEEQMEWAPMKWLYLTPFVLQLEQLIREGHDGPVDRFDATKITTDQERP